MKLSRCCCSLVAAVLFATTPLASYAQHEHEGHQMHGGSGALVGNLQLDQGRKWSTDASLRSGMANIRAAFDADHPAIHAGQETDGAYAALASRIEHEVNQIVANCRLAPAADAQLHYIVGDLLQGVGLMRGGDPAKSRHDGAALVHGALNAYGKFFDDPQWSPSPRPSPAGAGEGAEPSPRPSPADAGKGQG
jgi:hypothetical protein